MNKILKLIFTTTLLLSSTVLCTTEKNELNEIRTYEGVHLSSINDFRENSIRGPQHINIEDYKLEIYGLVEKPIKYTYDEIRSKFDKNKKVVTLHCVEGWSVKILWEGVQVEDIIEESAVKEEANTMIFYAHDGYSTSLPLEYILENDIMIAFKMNDIILSLSEVFHLSSLPKVNGVING